MLIDTHCHLNDEAFYGKEEEVIQRSIQNHVCKVLVCGYDPKSNLKALELKKIFPDVVEVGLGIHPSEIKKFDYIKYFLEEYQKLVMENHIIAIGECGLDYYWDKDNKEEQKKIFRLQIELSIQLHLPLSIHVRDAYQDAFDILKEYKNKAFGVIHCYSGSYEMAKEFVKLGYKLGIGGTSTFKNSKEIQKIIQELDIHYFVFETDSPYLAPVPVRGTQNEPGNVLYIAQNFSNLKGLSLDEVEPIIEKTTKNIFERMEKL